MLRRAGLSRTNHAQFTPYISKETVSNAPIYESLKSNFDDVFAYIDEKVEDNLMHAFDHYACLLPILQLKIMLPFDYDHLESIATVLPEQNMSAVHPFVGLVVNLNVVTTAHRDAKDHKFCLVLALGEFDGGELCLYEAGLVIPLRHGDFTVFPSCDLTHFNLHYNGLRASIVLHTDKEMLKWLDGDRNGWAFNDHFE